MTSSLPFFSHDIGQFSQRACTASFSTSGLRNLEKSNYLEMSALVSSQGEKEPKIEFPPNKIIQSRSGNHVYLTPVNRSDQKCRESAFGETCICCLQGPGILVFSSLKWGCWYPLQRVFVRMKYYLEYFTCILNTNASEVHRGELKSW